jgi:ABC-type dipeptide/oligopeptide/nickel transport system permease component
VFQYIIRRILATIPVLFGVSVLVFLFIHLIPGDPAVAMLGERATEENVARMRQQLGLDDPLPVQYVRFLFGETSFVVANEDNSYTTRRGEQCVEIDGAANVACRNPEGKWTGQQNAEMTCNRIASYMVCHDNGILWGDLGRSIQGNIPIGKELQRRFPATAELAIVAILIAVIVGVPAGVLASLKRNSFVDTATMFAALAGVSMPVFWLGILLMWLFGLQLGWLPTGGRLSPDVELETITNFFLLDSILTRNWEAFWDALRHVILPSIALATISLSIIARMTRSSMLDVLGQDYMRTAQAKGLARGTQIRRHAMRNAMMPVVTIIGLQFGGLLAGAILTETIFSWPGIGKWVFDAIGARDYTIVQSVTLIIAFTFVLVNLLVDISYAWLNPRIRYQ